MSIQGELTITLSPSHGTCRIRSTRPLQVGRLFAGKSIAYTLEKIPLLFSICAKAQAISTVRAIESAIATPASATIESQREGLIALESLREHCLRLLLDWPAYINEDIDRATLSHVAQGINHLMQALEPQSVLSCRPSESAHTQEPHQELWQGFSQTLERSLFASTVEEWLDSIHHSVNNWAAQQQTQTARFMHWLQQKDWKNLGASHLAEAEVIGGDGVISDQELVARLLKEQEGFTSQPDWQGNCQEFSWFSNQKHHAVIAQLSASCGNGLYTRMLARLVEVADLMQKLQRFFMQGALLQPTLSTEKGLAHTEAARGRLTHYIELENQTVKQLIILAPTEWNFHPKGVAQQSLQDLLVNRATKNNEILLKQQADLMVHAIDPCVGYQLQIDTAQITAQVTKEVIH